MNIQVRPLSPREGSVWEVCMGQRKVTFRSESEARAFVQTLEARLAAPHVLPEAERRQA
ncbi:hypothetical protein [Stutzerimonas chloritidismutans]|uniref:hypothetical protein n=1 Tax=Stutzerimonas chloritidismutans TaxID=203192 RepID=UPI003F5CF06D